MLATLRRNTNMFHKIGEKLAGAAATAGVPVPAPKPTFSAANPPAYIYKVRLHGTGRGWNSCSSRAAFREQSSAAVYSRASVLLTHPSRPTSHLADLLRTTDPSPPHSQPTLRLPHPHSRLTRIRRIRTRRKRWLPSFLYLFSARWDSR